MLLHFASTRYVPPKMRLKEMRRDDESIAYAETWAGGLSRVPWIGAAIAVVPGMLFAGDDPMTFFWGFVPAILLWLWYVIAFHGFANELTINRGQRTITVGHRWPDGSFHGNTFDRSAVRDIVLAARYRGPKFKLLYLNMIDGKTLEIDRGKELQQMERLASDVATTLELQLRQYHGDLFGMRLSVEKEPTSIVRYSDIRIEERRQSDKGLIGVSAVFLTISVVMTSLVFASHTMLPIHFNLEHLLGITFLLMFPVCGAAGLLTGILSLRSLRLFELEIHDGVKLVLHFRGLMSGQWEESWMAHEIDAVVKVVKSQKRKARCWQLWIRHRDGYWLLLDEDRSDWFEAEFDADLKSRVEEISDNLNSLALDLHKRLKVPIERCKRRFSLSKFQPPM